MFIDANDTRPSHSMAAGLAYDKFSLDKDAMTSMKAKMEEAAKNPQPQDYSKEAEVFFSHEGVKAFLESRMAPKNTDTVGNPGDRMFSDWMKKSGTDYNSLNSTDKADTLMKAYTSIYDEIERGYTGEEKDKKLDELNKSFMRKTDRIACQSRDELNSELIRQGKLATWDGKFLAPESEAANVYAGNVSDDIRDFVKSEIENGKSAQEIQTKGELEIMSKLSSNLLNAASLFTQQYGQAKPGEFDINSFLSGLSFLRK